jgi:hypothetical protein
MRNSRRRVGAEGERVRIATLYFNVLEAAGGIEEIPVRFELVGAFVNWIVIHTDGGMPTTTEASNLANPITVLEHLFRGGPPLPPPFPGVGTDPTPDTLGCSRS